MEREEENKKDLPTASPGFGVFCVFFFFPTICQVSGDCKIVALGVEAQKDL